MLVSLPPSPPRLAREAKWMLPKLWPHRMIQSQACDSSQPVRSSLNSAGTTERPVAKWKGWKPGAFGRAGGSILVTLREEPA